MLGSAKGHCLPCPITCGASADIGACTLLCMVQSVRTWIHLKACRIIVLAAFLAVASSSTSLADQLQWNASGVCEEAVQAIGSQSLLVSYCSQADEDYIELWLVSEAYTIGTPVEGLFEVIVRARPLHESRMLFSSKEFSVSDDCLAFREARDPRWFYGGIDLAYTYIHTGESTFQCLGRVLKLECLVRIETINLPDCVINGDQERKERWPPYPLPVDAPSDQPSWLVRS